MAYRRKYSDEVAALIFTNSPNRIGLVLKGVLWDLTEDEVRSAYPMPLLNYLSRSTGYRQTCKQCVYG